VALLESDVQGPVNIGSGSPVSIRDVLQEIGRQIGRPELIQLGAVKRNSGSKYLWANVQKLEKETAWFPRFTLTTGLQQTIEWWRNSVMIPDRDPIQQTKL
jgi:nucleoside-diphosphate-sugar epimerase